MQRPPTFVTSKHFALNKVSGMSSQPNAISEHGWTAIPLDADAIFAGAPYLIKPVHIHAKDIKFPHDDPIVVRAQRNAQDTLPIETYNHSMRVYYWAVVILQQQFPSYASTLSFSTLALACLLHDIGTAPSHLHSTRLSFEFHGAITALNLLLSPEYAASKSQAEAVCEAIIRHQDLGSEGMITFLGQLLQLATIFDNIGSKQELIHELTQEEVNKLFPRRNWNSCFAKTIREEVRVKPWAHSTHLGKSFADDVEKATFMAEYE